MDANLGSGSEGRIRGPRHKDPPIEGLYWGCFSEAYKLRGSWVLASRFTSITNYKAPTSLLKNTRTVQAGGIWSEKARRAVGDDDGDDYDDGDDGGDDCGDGDDDEDAGDEDGDDDDDDDEDDDDDDEDDDAADDDDDEDCDGDDIAM